MGQVLQGSAMTTQRAPSSNTAIAGFDHIGSILFLDWRGGSMLKRSPRNCRISQGRFGSERPPIGNPYGTGGFAPNPAQGRGGHIPDMPFAPLFDLVTNPLRQNDSI